MLIKSNEELFYNDEKNLLNFVLNNTFVKIPGSNYSMSEPLEMLELIITPECNQQCDYCYIHNYGHLSYPKEIRASKEKTLKNIEAILDFLFREKKYLFAHMEIFAGDLFSTGYFFDLIDLIFIYYDEVFKNEPYLKRKISNLSVIIPMNLKYVIDHNLEEQVIEKINKFKDIGMELAISWSHDGYYSQDVREKTELTEEYYDKAFTFMSKVPGGIHPMIGTENVKNACKNFDWWVEKYEKYFSNNPQFENLYYPGDLEVRNDGWTDETISQYLEYTKHKFEYLVKRCNNDLDTLVNYIFEKPQKDPNFTFKKRIHEFYDVFLDDFNRKRKGRSSCSLQNMMTIRCSDLAIVPCHRTCYHQFIGGWFILDEESNKIIDIKPNNVSQYIDLLYHRTDYAPRCINCWNNQYCLHGCLGSQFESSGELYLPIDSVCRLEMAKTSFSIKLLIESGVLKRACELGYVQKQVAENLYKTCIILGMDTSWKI